MSRASAGVHAPAADGEVERAHGAEDRDVALDALGELLDLVQRGAGGDRLTDRAHEQPGAYRDGARVDHPDALRVDLLRGARAERTVPDMAPAMWTETTPSRYSSSRW